MKVVLLVLFSCFWAMGQAQQCVLADHTQVYLAADKNSQLLATLGKGTEILDLYKQGEWHYIRTLRTDVKEQGFIHQNAMGKCKSLEKEEVPTTHTTTPNTSQEVLICNSKTASTYHHHECSGLSKCAAEKQKISLQTAQAKGLKPCGTCYKK